MNAMTNQQVALKNHLLAALPEDEFMRVHSKLEQVSLKLGEVLYESGDKLHHIHFPTTAIISLLYIMENGATAEIGVIGNDGTCGYALFLGGDSMANRAIVQSAGEAFRMPAKDVKDDICTGWYVSNDAVALYAGIDDADFTNRSLQPSASYRTTALPLAAA